MSNLETFDPHLAQKLEYKQQKYHLYVFARDLFKEDEDRISVNTIEKARDAWRKYKFENKWKIWILYKGNKIVKQGKF